MLDNYDGWTVEGRDTHKGKYRDNNGNGLFGLWRREHKSKYRMYVLNNGNIMTRYGYPKFDLPFASPMVRWQNLHYCNGWSMQGPDGNNIGENIHILQSVIDGLKPMGFAVAYEDKIEPCVELAKSSGLPYAINKKSWNDKLVEVAIGQHGVIGETFDIDALFRSYCRVGLGEFLDDEHPLEMLCELEESSFSDYLSDWNYWNPEEDYELVRIGLLLGYAVESTMACIVGDR